MLAYIYSFTLLSILFYTGFSILKNTSTEKRILVIIPAGAIFGVCLHIFLINLIAHFIQGPSGFYLAVFLQSIFAFFITKNAPNDLLIYPKGKEARIALFFMLLWIIFIYQITAHATTNGADSVLHQSFASRFIKGDYPMHQPWQPDYIAYYHFGGAQLLGSFHALTGAPYYFIHPFIAFFFLIFMSQILTYIIQSSEKITWKQMVVSSIPVFIGLISLGGIFIVWPARLELPTITNLLPVLSNAFENYGSPTNLDALVFFLHRFLAVSFIISMLTLLISPKKTSRLVFLILAIYLSTIALTDESVFIVTLLPILGIIFFKTFNKSLGWFGIFLIVITITVILQGGLITETLLNRYHEESSILLFPGNAKSVTEKYQDYRIAQQKSKFYPANEYTKTFNWFHPGIIWQLSLCAILTFYFFKKSGDSKKKSLVIFFFLSAAVSYIAFHALVPKGYTHPNGNRFLALSYFLSGIHLAIIISWWFSSKQNINRFAGYFFNLFIIWTLLFSVIPPLVNLFPRKIDNWFIIKKTNPDQRLEWIKKNLTKEERIVALTEIFPSNNLNIDIVTKTGVLTPVWAPKPRVHDSFDISPIYADLHYTLNPEIIKTLKINYLLITEVYLSQLPTERKNDLENKEFFTPVFISDDQKTKIIKIKEKYISEGTNFEGTFNQLDKIAPSTGTYCLDFPPNITDSTYRILRLIFHKRQMYCDHGGAFYNARLDISLDYSYYDENLTKFDYLVLGKNTDPETICNCHTELLWEGLGNNVRFWKTRY